MSPSKVNRKTDEYKSVFGNAERSGEGPGGTADWSGADPATITRLLGTVTSRGGAVRFGYTRDGGAYAVGFYYGVESTTKYCRPSEDLGEFLEYWIEFYENLPFTGGKSPETK